MKLLTFTLFVLLFRQSIAQSTGGARLVLSLSGGAHFSRHPGKNVVESFTYTSTLTGAAASSTQTFFGSLGGDFPRIGYMGDIMNVEVTSRHHAINGGIGLYPDIGSNTAGYLKSGYRWVLPFHRNKFQLKAGADVYLVLGSGMELGRIDNKNTTLELLGFTAGPQWTETYSSRNGSYTNTYNADHLSVLYRRNGLLVAPKVALSTNLKRLVLGLEAGWMLQLSQGCVLLLQQQDGGDNRHTIGKIHEPRNGSMSGPYAALSIGLINRSHHLFGK
ncbi:MAG TPA: hypothetical protein VNW04_22120 [Puia sp.]|jgi:hypothetical protein|nr:hypothetical protein [Puia sp.]